MDLESLAMTSYQREQNANVQLTGALSELLDLQRNEIIARELSLPIDSSPDLILKSVLTQDPGPVTASPFFRSQQGQLATIGFRAIGFGQCGLVYESPGTNYVLKIAKPAYEAGLWADFVAHIKIRDAFEQQKQAPECRVPRVFSYVPKRNKQWWDENLPLFTDVRDSFPLPGMTLTAEHILPLPKLAREALISKYCPQSSRSVVMTDPTNRDCLARVYLGRRRPTNAPATRNFTLRNYNLCLDQMIELGLPIENYAAAMGEALAIIHWSAHVDGYDIEFVLGSEDEGGGIYSRDISAVLDLTHEQVTAMPAHTDIESIRNANSMRRITRLWVPDFNLCSTFSERAGWECPDVLINHLVDTFFENDPYYPRPLVEDQPDQKLWDVFSSGYLIKAEELLGALEKDNRLAGLPRMFIDGCVLRGLRS